MPAKQITRELIDMIRDREKLSVPQLQSLRDALAAFLKDVQPGSRAEIGDTPATFAAALGGNLRQYHFELSPHIEHIGKRIAAFFNGEAKDKIGLLISTPPRHSKSETCSFWTPLWVFHKNPKMRVLLASYEATFAEQWGRRVRDFLLEYPEKLDLHVNPDHAAASGWSLQEGGSMFTAGVGGPMTGRGGDIIIIDDPIKNAEEAASQVYRDKAWDWFKTVAMTRLEPGGFMVVIGTRWHEDDLIGRLEKASLDGSGMSWETIKLPAIAEVGDPLGRPAGAALWPQRYPIEKLQDIRRSLGPYQFSALYQQNPTPEEGNSVLRRWWRFFTESPEEILEKSTKAIQTWDLAIKETTTGSFTVGFIMAQVGADIFVLDRFRKRINTPEMLTQIETWTKRYPKALAKLVEDKAAGPSVIAMLNKKIPGLVAWPPKGSKLQRLNAVIPLIESGNVYLPDTPWAKELIEEAAAFPNGAHDDQVDALTQGLTYLMPEIWSKLDSEFRTFRSQEKAKEANQARQLDTQFFKWIKDAKKEHAKKINGLTGRRTMLPY